MNELNIKFPGILLGYVSNVGYHLSSNECNDLTKLWSHNEYKYDRLEIECDQLKVENKKFREQFQKLSDIPLETYTLSEINDIAMLMRYIAKQALNKVETHENI